MTTNPVRGMLEEVARGGGLPSEEQLTALMTRGSRTEREARRRGSESPRSASPAAWVTASPSLAADLEDLVGGAEVKFASTTARADGDLGTTRASWPRRSPRTGTPEPSAAQTAGPPPGTGSSTVRS